jgi:steroid delta-isomerase-like uncharacterized protein
MLDRPSLASPDTTLATPTRSKESSMTSETRTQPTDQGTMTQDARSIEANKQLVRRFVQEIFVDGNADAVDELVAEDFVPHTWPSTGDGRADLKRAIERVSKSLSDPSFAIEDMIAEDDRVAVRLTASARQTGEFMGIPPSGTSYTIGEIHIFRMRDGKVTEHWHQFDQMGMMRQLGALPGKG